MEARNEYSIGQSDERPWGRWAVMDAGPGFCVKRITVIPGGILSLQRHAHRSEDWIVVAGKARATIEGELIDLEQGDRIRIARTAVHRVANAGSADLVLIEVQHGDVLSESDIERLEDSYGRTGAS
jgi:mannose-6-phosphate isomerase